MIDGGSFTVGQNEYLAVRITNKTNQAYNLLTGGAWSYVSIKESEEGGISSVSPSEGFTAGQVITIEGADFCNSEERFCSAVRKPVIFQIVLIQPL